MIVSDYNCHNFHSFQTPTNDNDESPPTNDGESAHPDDDEAVFTLLFKVMFIVRELFSLCLTYNLSQQTDAC